jgi:hypothetical protein
MCGLHKNGKKSTFDAISQESVVKYEKDSTHRCHSSKKTKVGGGKNPAASTALSFHFSYRYISRHISFIHSLIAIILRKAAPVSISGNTF